MKAPTDSSPLTPPIEQILARVARHEVGDLLQTIYAAVALLQDRLPAGGVERQVVTELKTRAETCRLEIDALVDLVCPLQVQRSPLDLGVLTGAVVEPLRARYSRRTIQVQSEAGVSVVADGQRLAQVIALLLRSACVQSSEQVRVRVARRERQALWEVWRDGPPAQEEQLTWLTHPLTTTRHALPGLGLALAQRVLDEFAGRVEVLNPDEGGFLVRLLLSME
jgi:two-component system sensor histidine kinase RegB